VIARILLTLTIVSLIVPVLILGCNEANIPKQEINMDPKNVIPAIDTSVPTEIETATFALG
jgi:hypothetical protein